MEPSRHSFNIPAAFRSRRKRLWMYTILVLFFVVQLVGYAGGSKNSRIFSRIRQVLHGRRRVETANDAAAEAVEESVPPEEPQTGEDGMRWSRHQAHCLALAQSAAAVFQSYFPEGFMSRASHETQPCAAATTPGLGAVTAFLSLVPSNDNDKQPWQDVFPSNDPVALLSARRGILEYYWIENEAPWLSIKQENGRSFTVTPVNNYHGSQSQNDKASAFFSELRNDLRLHKLFNVNSLRTVECKYRLKTIQDILLHPAPELRAPCSDEFLARCFLVYSEAKVSLLQLVETIDKKADASQEMTRQARRARLNLSLQLVDVVGKIRLKRVLLPRFSIQDFLVDDRGTLYIHPKSSPLRELVSSTYGKWELLGVSTTAEDTAMALLYIWCPQQAQSLLLSTNTFNQKNVLAAVTPTRCPAMHGTIRALLLDILSGTQDLDEVRYVSASYMDVETLLQKDIHRQKRTVTHTGPLPANASLQDKFEAFNAESVIPIPEENPKTA